MDKDTRNAAFAAAAILIGFGVAAFYLPALIVRLGDASPFAGGAVAVLFVAAFFGVFWLRGRSRRDWQEGGHEDTGDGSGRDDRPQADPKAHRRR